MSYKKVKPSQDIVKARERILETVKEVSEDLPSEKVLALLAYTVGQCLALQDQRKMTIDQAFDLINRNIKQGNYDVVSSLLTGNPLGSA